ncbi:MAG: glycoside hydrolase family 140 protein [Chitinophagales bacterium]
MKSLFLTILIIFVIKAEAQLPLLKISSNKRFFQTADGKPFFWLGDTGWLLFVKCNREDAIKYLDTRREQGFNVIQVMVLHDVKNKNAYGDYALKNADVSMANVTPGNNFNDTAAYDYWDHVEFIIDEAGKRGIYIALVAVWGSNVKSGKVNLSNAEAYAKFLALRFKNKNNIIWIDGGDIPGNEGTAVWQTIAKTIKKHDNKHLMTFHPRGRYSSSDWFHQESWLDFNMFQSGHKDYAQDTSSKEKHHYGEDNWKFVDVDYRMKPIKPTLDGEPSYENIPHGLHDSLETRWTDADLRRYAFWSVFAGAAGFTYGENAIMQFYTLGESGGSFGVNQNWKETVNAPGAGQMQHLKKLILGKSYFDRVPDQGLVIDNGDRYERVFATRGKNYAMFYSYNSSPFNVAINKMNFVPKRGWWFRPSDGQTTRISEYRNTVTATFDPPGEKMDGNDWVLILER